MSLTGDARVAADSSRGIRSIRFSPNGQHMAVGDRTGNLKYVPKYYRSLLQLLTQNNLVLKTNAGIFVGGRGILCPLEIILPPPES